MTLNSFRKHFLNVLFTVFRFVCNKNYDHGQDFHFYHKTKRKAADKTLEQRFLKEFKDTCNTSGDSELKEPKMTWNAP